MAISIYSKSNIDEIKHFGSMEYEDLMSIRKVAENSNLACLKFLPYGGDIIFNAEQAGSIDKNEIPVLYENAELRSKCLASLEIIAAAVRYVADRTHTFLYFEGD